MSENPDKLTVELLDAAVDLMGRQGRGGTLRVRGVSMIPTLIGRQLVAVEFAPVVRVNAIAVGAVDTSALGPFLNDELRAAMEQLTPMQRIGSVEDIALGALYLASPAAGWVTGKIFEIDGGTETTNWPFD